MLLCPFLQRTALVMGFTLLMSCSDGVQTNKTIALASKDGGTSGGEINGTLEVQVFDDTVRFPMPGVHVALGGSGTRFETTNGQGIATFRDVFGPQDIHVYHCLGCDDDVALPLRFRVSSFYQVNANHISVSLLSQAPAASDATIQGKVSDVEKDQTTFLMAMDRLGSFETFGPTKSVTYQQIDFNDQGLTFLYSKDIDAWAEEVDKYNKAKDSEAEDFTQIFGETAVLGKVGQAGIRISARYFRGDDAGQVYYFDANGKLDLDLESTSKDGRFLFLKLTPGNDLVVSAINRGTGVGLRYLHLPLDGAIVFSLPIQPLFSFVRLSGRVVAYRHDYREEEEKGVLSNNNIGVPRAFINFSGGRPNEIVLSNEGAISGNYQIGGRLPNSRYIVIITGSSSFRATDQEVSFSDRSKLNYPLTVVPLSLVTNIIRQAQIPDTARAGEDGVIPNRSGPLPGNGEMLGRVLEKTTPAAIDANGDPKVQALSNAFISVTDEMGVSVGKAYAIDSNHNIICNFEVSTCTTDASGGFMVFDLPTTQGLDVYTIRANEVNADGTLIDRQTIVLYSNRVRLVDLLKRGGSSTTIASPLNVTGAGNKAIKDVSLSLVGGTLACGVLCVTDASGNVAINNTSHQEGDYWIKMEKGNGGGDFEIPIQASKRRLGFTAFRIGSNDEDYNISLRSGQGPLAPVGRLKFEVGFEETPKFIESIGNLSLPFPYTDDDIVMVSIGAIVPAGRVFIGTDTGILTGTGSSQYRVRSTETEGTQSYFAAALVEDSDGNNSYILTQGLQEIPETLDLVLPPPPTQILPADESTNVGLTPTLSWVPNAGPVDLYLVDLLTESGDRLWRAWVPGSLQSITLPTFPVEGTTLPNPIVSGESVVWKVDAIRANNFSFHDFNVQELHTKIVDRAFSTSGFTP